MGHTAWAAEEGCEGQSHVIIIGYLRDSHGHTVPTPDMSEGRSQEFPRRLGSKALSKQ